MESNTSGEAFILIATLLHAARIAPIFLLPWLVSWLDRFPFTAPAQVVRSHVLYALLCLLSVRLVPWMGEERADDAASVVSIGATGLALASSVSGRRRTRDTPPAQFVGVTLFLTSFTLLPCLFGGAYWLSFFSGIVSVAGLAVNLQGFAGRGWRAWRGEDKRAPELVASFEGGGGGGGDDGDGDGERGERGPPPRVEWIEGKALTSRYVHEWDDIRLLHRPKRLYDRSEAALPVRRGVYLLEGNPVEAYADLTRLRWSEDRSVAILPYGAHWRAERSMRGSRLLAAAVDVVASPEVVFRMETGELSHTLFGLHVRCFPWYFEVQRDGSIVRTTGGGGDARSRTLQYTAKCVLEVDAQTDDGRHEQRNEGWCLKETAHARRREVADLVRRERIAGPLVTDADCTPVFPRLAGWAGNRARFLLTKLRSRREGEEGGEQLASSSRRQPAHSSTPPPPSVWFDRVVFLHDTGRRREARRLCSSHGVAHGIAFDTLLTEATRSSSFLPSTASADRLCAAAYRARRGLLNLSESEVFDGCLRCGLPACGLDFALSLSAARLRANEAATTARSGSATTATATTTSPAFLRPDAARLSFCLLSFFAMLLLDPDWHSSALRLPGRPVSSDVVAAGCIVGMSLCRLVSLGCRTALCWEGGTPLLDFLTLVSFLTGPNGDLHQLGGSDSLLYYHIASAFRCATVSAYGNVFRREGVDEAPSSLHWLVSFLPALASSSLILLSPGTVPSFPSSSLSAFPLRAFAYLLSCAAPSILLFLPTAGRASSSSSLSDRWAVRLRVCAPGLTARRPPHSRQILFEPTTVTVLVVLLANLLSYLLGREAYDSFMASNPIRDRIGFNNLCVYFDMHPYSSLSGSLLYVNVFTMLFQLTADGSLAACLLLGLTPCFLLIFLVSPSVDLFTHAVLGYGTILLHTSYHMWSKWRRGEAGVLSALSSALVLLYLCLVFLAFGTDVTPLPSLVTWAGYAIDRLIFLFFLYHLLAELGGRRSKMYHLQFTADVGRLQEEEGED